MAKVEKGSFTIPNGDTSLQTIILNDDTIDIEKIVFMIVSSATETSNGFSDGTTNFTANDNYGDTSIVNSIHHFRNISSVKTKTFEGKVPTGGLATVGEFQFKPSVVTQNTTVKFTAHGN